MLIKYDIRFHLGHSQSKMVVLTFKVEADQRDLKNRFVQIQSSLGQLRTELKTKLAEEIKQQKYATSLAIRFGTCHHNHRDRQIVDIMLRK